MLIWALVPVAKRLAAIKNAANKKDLKDMVVL
jgi:hypothetical protein